MGLSVKDRKMLWALSKNKCAICGCPLVEKTSHLNIVIGEECHIVSMKPNGPRHRTMQNYDTFDNFILLCPKHHKIIDEDVIIYPEEKLLYIKKHSQGFVLDDSESDYIIMFKINNPIELFNYINGAIQYAKSYPSEEMNDKPLFEEFFDILLNEFDLLNGEINEFQTDKIFKDIFSKLYDKGYCILATVKDNFGENRLRTAFVYIRKESELASLRYSG